jgi:hypothetical protein
MKLLRGVVDKMTEQASTGNPGMSVGSFESTRHHKSGVQNWRLEGKGYREQSNVEFPSKYIAGLVVTNNTRFPSLTNRQKT